MHGQAVLYIGPGVLRSFFSCQEERRAAQDDDNRSNTNATTATSSGVGEGVRSSALAELQALQEDVQLPVSAVVTKLYPATQLSPPPPPIPPPPPVDSAVAANADEKSKAKLGAGEEGNDPATTSAEALLSQATAPAAVEEGVTAGKGAGVVNGNVEESGDAKLLAAGGQTGVGAGSKAAGANKVGEKVMAQPPSDASRVDANGHAPPVVSPGLETEGSALPVVSASSGSTLPIASSSASQATTSGSSESVAAAVAAVEAQPTAPSASSATPSASSTSDTSTAPTSSSTPLVQSKGSVLKASATGRDGAAAATAADGIAGLGSDPADGLGGEGSDPKMIRRPPRRTAQGGGDGGGNDAEDLATGAGLDKRLVKAGDDVDGIGVVGVGGSGGSSGSVVGVSVDGGDSVDGRAVVDGDGGGVGSGESGDDEDGGEFTPPEEEVDDETTLDAEVCSHGLGWCGVEWCGVVWCDAEVMARGVLGSQIQPPPSQWILALLIFPRCSILNLARERIRCAERLGDSSRCYEWAVAKL